MYQYSVGLGILQVLCSFILGYIHIWIILSLSINHCRIKSPTIGLDWLKNNVSNLSCVRIVDRAGNVIYRFKPGLTCHLPPCSIVLLPKCGSPLTCKRIYPSWYMGPCYKSLFRKRSKLPSLKGQLTPWIMKLESRRWPFFMVRFHGPTSMV